jgi:Pyruvate/2-oxoacid:ferredoxin oxidoreductase gamma subunit
MPIGVIAYGVPLTRIATDLGKPLVKNIAALGALHAATFLAAIRRARTRVW